MRLGKMCGLLMKAFLAVLMLFVTAAAVEVYWEDEFDEAIANQCESIISVSYTHLRAHET